MWKGLFYTINQLFLKCKFNKININEWIFMDEITCLYAWKPMIYSLLFKLIGGMFCKIEVIFMNYKSKSLYLSK